MLAILLTCVEFTKQILTSRSLSDLIIFGILSPNDDSDLNKAKIFYYHRKALNPRLTRPSSISS